jgi:DNA-binding winged helix-turn-helix (wHTH) protein
MTSVPPVYRFGSFVFRDGELWRDHESISLTPRQTAGLLYLLDHAGELLRTDSMIKGLWPDCHVETRNLTVLICELRRVLGDNPTTPTYIDTRPRLGYRFIAPVQIESLGTSDLEAILPIEVARLKRELNEMAVTISWPRDRDRSPYKVRLEGHYHSLPSGWKLWSVTECSASKCIVHASHRDLGFREFWLWACLGEYRGGTLFDRGSEFIVHVVACPPHISAHFTRALQDESMPPPGDAPGFGGRVLASVRLTRDDTQSRWNPSWDDILGPGYPNTPADGFAWDETNPT